MIYATQQDMQDRKPIADITTTDWFKGLNSTEQIFAHNLHNGGRYHMTAAQAVAWIREDRPAPAQVAPPAPPTGSVSAPSGPKPKFKPSPITLDDAKHLTKQWLDSKELSDQNLRGRHSEDAMVVTKSVLRSLMGEYAFIPEMEDLKKADWASDEYKNLDPGTLSVAVDEAKHEEGLLLHRVMSGRYLTIVWLTSSPSNVRTGTKGVGATLIDPVLKEADAKDMAIQVSAEGPVARAFYVRCGFGPDFVPGMREYWRPSKTIREALRANRALDKRLALRRLDVSYAKEGKLSKTEFLAEVRRICGS